MQELNGEVHEGIERMQTEENMVEMKDNAGPATQYLLMVLDEDRALFTLDQVLALYLIDLAEMCKQSKKVALKSSNQTNEKESKNSKKDTK